MCKFCDKLLNSPVGEKRKVILNEGKYINGWLETKTEMVLDRYENRTEAFIHTEMAIDGYWCNLPFDISYCPFCGKLLTDKKEGAEE